MVSNGLVFPATSLRSFPPGSSSTSERPDNASHFFSVSDRHNFKSFMLDKAKHTPVQCKLSGSDTPSSSLKRSRLETSTTKHHFAFSGYISKNFSHHDLASTDSLGMWTSQIGGYKGGFNYFSQVCKLMEDNTHLPDFQTKRLEEQEANLNSAMESKKWADTVRTINKVARICLQNFENALVRLPGRWGYWKAEALAQLGKATEAKVENLISVSFQYLLF
ncbi:hypothetical protein PtB15_2B851 [Puccinia triticina]|nr:hypothetical protein PtB15_2B851 [Puccinia triticina]